MPGDDRGKSAAGPAEPGMNAAGASAWMSASRIVAQATSLVLLLVAARFLTPAELGAFVLCSATAMLLTRVAEAGWPQYAMAWPERGDPPATVLWCAIGSGLLISLLGFAIAGGVTIAFRSATYGELVFLLVLTVLPGTFITVQQGILTRRERVGAISKVAILANLAGMLGGLVALVTGLGVFALAVDKLINVAVATFGTLLVARWIPRFELDLVRAREIVAYASHIIASRIVAFGQNYGAEFLIGLFLGATEVGLFRAGARIVGALTEILVEPSRVMAWALLSKAVREGRKPGVVTGEIAATLLFIAAPIFVGLALVSPNVPGILFGAGWELTAPVMAILAIARLVNIVANLAEPLLAVSGRTPLIPRLAVLGLTVNWICLAALAHRGIVWAAASQLLSACIVMPILVRILIRHAHLDWRPALKGASAATACTVLMAVAVLLAKALTGMATSATWAVLGAEVAAGALTYAAATRLLNPPLFEQVRDLVLQRRRSAAAR